MHPEDEELNRLHEFMREEAKVREEKEEKEEEDE